jgi:hypothetical protein
MVFDTIDHPVATITSTAQEHLALWPMGSPRPRRLDILPLSRGAPASVI